MENDHRSEEAVLDVRSGPAEGQRLRVGSERFIIGRDSACDLVLDESKISRRHAYLVRLPDGRVEVGDLGSANGTWVNGKRVERPVQISDRDHVALGTTELQTRGVAPPPPETLAAKKPVESRSIVSSMVQRIKLERSVRRATLLATAAVLAAAAAVTLAVTGVFDSDEPSAPAASEIVSTVTPSTVRILTNVNGRLRGSGTGWVYDADKGLIVTNAHVIGEHGEPGELTYEVLVGDETREASLYANAPCYDVALLKVDDTSDLVTLPLGSQSELAQGEDVIVIGFPGNVVTSFEESPLQSTSGSVSVVETSQQPGSEASLVDPNASLYPNLVQTDAAINSGNSGGPLVNTKKQLVGINTLTTIETQGQGFAIGVDWFKELATTLATGDSIGFLGFDFKADGEGLVVNNAVSGSDAARRGLGSETVLVTSVDGNLVGTREDYCDAVEDAESGDTVDVSGIDSVGRRFGFPLEYE